jgi:hypothetical protein
MRLIFSSVFEQDFAELVIRFSEADSPNHLADRFEKRTYDLIELSLEAPGTRASAERPKTAGIRSFPIRGFRRYLLFYQVKGDEMILLRLRYGGMDLPMLFPG